MSKPITVPSLPACRSQPCWPQPTAGCSLNLSPHVRPVAMCLGHNHGHEGRLQSFHHALPRFLLGKFSNSSLVVYLARNACLTRSVMILGLPPVVVSAGED